MRKLLAIALFGALSFSTQAADKPVFSCTATDGTPIIVKRVGDNYELSYGKLQVKTPIKQALKNQNSEIAHGSGFTTSTLELGNKAQSYVVGFIQPRGSRGDYMDPTLSYYKNGSLGDTTINCDMNKPFSEDFASQKIRQFP